MTARELARKWPRLRMPRLFISSSSCMMQALSRNTCWRLIQKTSATKLAQMPAIMLVRAAV
eukprot:14156865-Heterocapsa_arctica.AAC.1